MGGHTSLYFAVFGGIYGSPTETVKRLLEKGSDPNLATEQGTTPLHVAYQKQRKDISVILLQNNANPLAEDSWGHIPSDYPLEKKKKKCTDCLNIFRFLRRKKTNLNTQMIAKN